MPSNLPAIERYNVTIVDFKDTGTSRGEIDGKDKVMFRQEVTFSDGSTSVVERETTVEDFRDHYAGGANGSITAESQLTLLSDIRDVARSKIDFSKTLRGRLFAKR
jgi:hypothetical protein